MVALLMSEYDAVLAEVRALMAEVRAERATVDAYRAETLAWHERLVTRFDQLDQEVGAIARRLMNGDE
jgi:hypothetical protein